MSPSSDLYLIVWHKEFPPDDPWAEALAMLGAMYFGPYDEDEAQELIQRMLDDNDTFELERWNGYIRPLRNAYEYLGGSK